MNRIGAIERILASRRALRPPWPLELTDRGQAAEGGCGVIGLASSEQVAGRHLLQALDQMRNRGNGKGGGIAAVGLIPEEFGVTQAILDDDYLLTIAYLDPTCRAAVEQRTSSPPSRWTTCANSPTSPTIASCRGWTCGRRRWCITLCV
jgi:hypothetical protein